MGPGSTVRHDTRAAQESHSCMLLQVFFVKGSRRNKRVHCGVHCPRPKHDAENYIFAMEALAYLGSLWKSDRKFILPVLQI